MFVISDPEIDFEVIDFGPDGIGDEVFDTFNTVSLGTSGEIAEIAEFDIDEFLTNAVEVIDQATFQGERVIIC